MGTLTPLSNPGPVQTLENRTSTEELGTDTNMQLISSADQVQLSRVQNYLVLVNLQQSMGLSAWLLWLVKMSVIECFVF